MTLDTQSYPKSYPKFFTEIYPIIPTLAANLRQPTHLPIEFRDLHPVATMFFDCKSEQYIKATTYSLFGTIAAFKKMKSEDPDLHFEYVLSAGTALAFERNTPIFPWDSDSDIYLIFEDNLNDDQLAAFYNRLELELKQILGAELWMKWRTDERWDWFLTPFHFFQVKAGYREGGWLDVFICFHDSSKTKLRTGFFGGGPLWHWQDESLVFPIQKNQEWAVYGVEVDIAANTRMLEMSHDTNKYRSASFHKTHYTTTFFVSMATHAHFFTVNKSPLPI